MNILIITKKLFDFSNMWHDDNRSWKLRKNSISNFKIGQNNEFANLRSLQLELLPCVFNAVLLNKKNTYENKYILKKHWRTKERISFSFYLSVYITSFLVFAFSLLIHLIISSSTMDLLFLSPRGDTVMEDLSSNAPELRQLHTTNGKQPSLSKNVLTNVLNRYTWMGKFVYMNTQLLSEHVHA